MDSLDRRILAALQATPDLTTADVAAIVGLSQTPCWRRIKRLEEEGKIRGRAVLLDPQALGLTVNVFASLRLRQHDEATLEAFEAGVRGHEEIVECFSIAGESDYLLRVIVPSIDAYERFLKKVLLHLPGVGAVNSNFALGCVKITTSLPLGQL